MVPDPAAPGSITSIPEIFSEEEIADAPKTKALLRGKWVVA